MQESDDASESSGINRRSLLRGAAAASVTGGSLVGLSGGAAAKTESIASPHAVEVFDTRASELLDTLSAEGLLEDASAEVLSTAPTTRTRSDVGVARAYNDEGTEFYVAREETARGKLTILVKPETDRTLGVLSTDDGIETYGPNGQIEPTDCTCSDDPCNLSETILYCLAFPTDCCNY